MVFSSGPPGHPLKFGPVTFFECQRLRHANRRLALRSVQTRPSSTGELNSRTREGFYPLRGGSREGRCEDLGIARQQRTVRACNHPDRSNPVRSLVTADRNGDLFGVGDLSRAADGGVDVAKRVPTFLIASSAQPVLAREHVYRMAGVQRSCRQLKLRPRPVFRARLNTSSWMLKCPASATSARTSRPRSSRQRQVECHREALRSSSVAPVPRPRSIWPTREGLAPTRSPSCLWLKWRRFRALAEGRADVRRARRAAARPSTPALVLVRLDRPGMPGPPMSAGSDGHGRRDVTGHGRPDESSIVTFGASPRISAFWPDVCARAGAPESRDWRRCGTQIGSGTTWSSRLTRAVTGGRAGP